MQGVGCHGTGPCSRIRGRRHRSPRSPPARSERGKWPSGHPVTRSRHHQVGGVATGPPWPDLSQIQLLAPQQGRYGNQECHRRPRSYVGLSCFISLGLRVFQRPHPSSIVISHFSTKRGNLGLSCFISLFPNTHFRGLSRAPEKTRWVAVFCWPDLAKPMSRVSSPPNRHALLLRSPSSATALATARPALLVPAGPHAPDVTWVSKADLADSKLFSRARNDATHLV